jgi:tripeptide aminopeptidase
MMSQHTLLSLTLLVLLSTAHIAFAQQSDELKTDRQYVDQVDRLLNHHVIQQAIQFIHDYDDQTVQNQITITEVPAPPFMEDERAEKYADMLRHYGLNEISIDDEGNVIGRRARYVGR